MTLTADALDFQALLDASAEAVVVHDADTEAIVWANRAASAIYGYSLEELTRMSVTDLAARDPRYTHSAARNEVEHALSKDHHSFEWRIRTRAGDEFPIETTATYVSWSGKRAIMIQLRDISDRKLTENALKRYELRFREFMQDLAEGVLILSRTGAVDYLSPSACRLLGCEQQDMLGHSIQDRLDRRSGRELLARFADPQPEVRSIRYRIRHADGSWRWHDATYRYVEIENDVRGFLLHFRDISDRIAAELAAREKEKMLEYLARHSAMGEMAAAIAHELSQPLAATQNYIEGGILRLERDVREKDEVVRGLRHAVLQIDRAATIIQSIRSYIVKLELAREQADLNDVLSEVRYFIELRARQMSVRVAWYLAEAPLSILCERVLIGQVILNLAFNAIDEMAELRASRRLLRLATTMDGAYALLRVEDRGRGLPAGREKKLFDGFFTTKATGNGIGLSLCQNIVSKHAGSIWAEPGKGQGTVFYVKLPLAQSATIGTDPPVRFVSSAAPQAAPRVG
ncbi:MAG TPA: PAS domain S-box protein [Steroidobacteraceae bacterium]|jgi:PAS domain S-box-containing protein